MDIYSYSSSLFWNVHRRILTTRYCVNDCETAMCDLLAVYLGTIQVKMPLPWIHYWRGMMTKMRMSSTTFVTYLYWSTWTMTWVRCIRCNAVSPAISIHMSIWAPNGPWASQTYFYTIHLFSLPLCLQYAKLAISLRVPGGGVKKKKTPAAPQGAASGEAAPEEDDDYEGGLC